MATRYAVATGNWSAVGTWDGGTTLPSTGDDVFSNNFIVTVDQNISVRTLRNTSNASPSITAGGYFDVTGSSGTRTITLSGTTGTGGVSASGVFSNASTAGNSALRISATSGATINITTPLGAPQTSVGSTIAITGNSTITISGVFGASQTNFPLFRFESTAANGTTNIVGNITSGGGTNFGGTFLNASNYTVNITGNIVGSGDSGLLLQAATILNITGNITGGTGTGILLNGGGGGTFNITGNITAGTSAGINVNGTNQTIVVNGIVTASSTANGIVGNSTGTLVTVNGNLVNTSDFMAVNAFKMRISPSTSQSWKFQTSGSDRFLYTANSVLGQPAVTDVRYGVVYASGSLTGTCYVPGASSVSAGVPVDNTTGTAVIDISTLMANISALIT